MVPTRHNTTMPIRNHTGDSPTVTAKKMNAHTISVENAPSMVICMSSAAPVALPAGMPRRRASSTTNVVPARFMDGAIVFMKNVPNTSGNVDFGSIRSPTAAKLRE